MAGVSDELVTYGSYVQLATAIGLLCIGGGTCTIDPSVESSRCCWLCSGR